MDFCEYGINFEKGHKILFVTQIFLEQLVLKNKSLVQMIVLALIHILITKTII
jgi:hypothetical protein